MVIAYGTHFCGKISTIKGQWIESKFFAIMYIPIFPLDSMLVTGSTFRKRQGFSIGLNAKSVMAVYARLFTMGLAAWFLFNAWVCFTNHYQDLLSSGIQWLLAAVLMIILCIYFYFFFGKAKTQDAIMRKRVGYLTSYYALPHWFSRNILRDALKTMEEKYRQDYPENDWKADLDQKDIEPHKLKLLFGLALFNRMYYNAPEDDRLYAIVNEQISTRDLTW